ncbi:MAG: valine--tRNA ligase, partial [Nitrospinaceae bacterium]
MSLDKTYDPSAIEGKWYRHWESSGAFLCGQRKDAEPYTIVIPLPNVTGSLHIGHALNNTIQDALIRFERLRGKDALWQIGLDHAGIATQMVVERQLDGEGIKRRDLGREKFLERVWQWKEKSGGLIFTQLKRLGASCDWPRERFTMDDGFVKAVRKKFIDLYNEGLIYKDKRLVNWDPKLLTAISDLEVEQREIDGFYWHFRYPLKDTPKKFIVVVTTRPETMLGDTAVAVHPKDPRYHKLVGKMIAHPLTGRDIPIIADNWADPETGSGAVKITPAHDFNDFEVGKRHDLPKINILDQHGAINENAPKAYQGLDRFEARKKVVTDLDALGLLEKIEPKKIMAPFGDRSGVVIEPWLTDQWYVDAETLAKPAIKAVEDGRTKIVPKTWEKTYFEWMRNIQPWCISRQLWWGHRIPAWYAEDGTFFVAETKEEAGKLAGEGVKLTQDEDVLDTWFSSAMWPFATLGWPGKTSELARYYPNSVLVTAFDILFFWVARMMMDGLQIMGEVPFHTVYIHGLVRDEAGQKMSKSRGNVVDPLEFIDKYGADALRFTLAVMETQGRDIKLSESRVQGYRNFATKLWNAARFCEMNGAVDATGFDPRGAANTVNQWIIGETKACAEKVTKSLEAYRFNEATGAIYHFTWGTFCDWYLELIKSVLAGNDQTAKVETQKTAAWVLDNILLLLHPFMPFITEELWNAFGVKRDADLILSTWPIAKNIPEHKQASEKINWIIRLITNIRSTRADLNVPPKAIIDFFVCDPEDETNLREANFIGKMRSRMEHFLPDLGRLARVNIFERLKPEKIPSHSAQFIMDGITFVLPLEGV